MKICDVGCGRNKVKGSIGIDSSCSSHADIIHDLNVYPYPFPDDEFDLVYCRDVLEHLNDIPRVMAEIYRILKPGGILKIITPHYTSDNSYADPTHKYHFSIRSFDYFIVGKNLAKGIYTEALFQEIIKRIKFSDLYKLGDLKINVHRLIGLEWVVNKFPRIYEKFFAFIMPANEIYIELCTPKNKGVMKAENSAFKV